ncbi:substrate-binding domain-containing protein [Cellvibrio polysaccharolyticus]|uniref:Phosphonate ABC transporter substrate-binding protein n=1 Tax=Cellvibrio polysaccharolyticus TaxID=2082724 RepID=A0A928YUR2_9GAMM|nr:substrate-binding domain-containing protein [Cellvibrio polysaccharolyticus]MBE8716308.1 phosphonate ABC transporter substrate-binding protein [Cellvibrio polysaccharolyticus]
MTLKPLAKLAAVSLIAVSCAAVAQNRDTIQVAGSSTVLPFASIVAEEFGNNFPQFKTPVVGSGGSSGGLRQFCQGVGANTIDIANSSRAIRPAEIDACKAAGVNQIIEVKIGYDGIVFASRIDAGDFKLEPKHVFLAQADKVPQGGKLVANPYTRWSQIDKSLPDQEILLAIPGSNHGTREVYEEKVVHPGCMEFDEIKKLDKDAAAAQCVAMRTDGRVVEIAGDYTETLARLQAQKDAVGVFGLSFYEANRDRIKVASVSGVVPTLDAILDGKYPVSRPLFFYVKGEHIGVIPGLQEFANYFVSEQVSGTDSPLEAAGLIPLSDKERADVANAIKQRKAK